MEGKMEDKTEGKMFLRTSGEDSLVLTPNFGLPSVPLGEVADFICCAYSRLAPITLQWHPLWMLFHPWSQQ
jgi:hypothetical protein